MNWLSLCAHRNKERDQAEDRNYDTPCRADVSGSTTQSAKPMALSVLLSAGLRRETGKHAKPEAAKSNITEKRVKPVKPDIKPMEKHVKPV